MRFTDFAGNSECSNIIIAKIDDTAPIYKGDKINAFLDGETNKINLELGEFNDEKSGIDRLEIEIKPLLNNGNISEIYKYLFTPEDNKKYVTEYIKLAQDEDVSDFMVL